eukprot:1359607-Prymnesium_polylepis.1
MSARAHVACGAGALVCSVRDGARGGHNARVRRRAPATALRKLHGLERRAPPPHHDAAAAAPHAAGADA